MTFLLFSLGITVLARAAGAAAHRRAGPAVAGAGAGWWRRAARAAEPAGHAPAASRAAAQRGVRLAGRANSHQTALPPPGVRREPQVEAIVATMAMPRPASSAGFGAAAARQVVVAVGDLDDQAAVGAAQAQAHRRGAVLEGVGDQFAGGEDAQVVQFRGEAPAGEDAGGEGTRAWGRFDAAEQLQGGVAEELARPGRCGRGAGGRGRRRRRRGRR